MSLGGVDDSEYLRKLIRKRDSTSRRIVRISSQLENLVAEDGDDASIDAARIDQKDLEKCFTLFESTQDEIEDEVPEQELEEQEVERVRIAGIVRQAKVNVSNFIRLSVKTKETSGIGTGTVMSSPAPKVKRPEITVPKFNGDVKKWSEFRNVFTSIVIDEKVYSDVERMIYLKQSVEGKAADLVANFEISRENFAKAWEKLRKRYENRRAVISTHLEALCKLPPAKAETEVAPLLDAATDTIESLKALGVTNGWEMMLCHLVSTKLDSETRKQWELLIVKEAEYPSYVELEKFLHERVRVFEAINGAYSSSKITSKKEKVGSERQRSLATSLVSSNNTLKLDSGAEPNRFCFDCGASSHSLAECKTFSAKSLADKRLVVQKRGLCYNCFNKGHRVTSCRLKRCEKCGKKHHVLLHSDEFTLSSAQAQREVSGEKDQKQGGESVAAKTLLTNTNKAERVCLPAALVYVKGKNGHHHLVRAFLDSCGSINAISEKLVKKLQCKTQSSNVALSALIPGEYKVTHSCELKIKSRVNKYELVGRFQILPLIANEFESFDADPLDKKWTWGHQLADDPKINSGRVDLLIGAEFYEEVTLNRKIQVGERAYLRETEFGWVFMGQAKFPPRVETAAPCFLTLEASFQRFLSLEEMDDSQTRWTEEEKKVDAEFEKSFTRDDEGRFVVTLPKRLTVDVLGESRKIAFRRLLSLENRFKKSAIGFDKYNAFLIEYENLGHMCCVDSSQALVYLPHHAVYRETSSTTKVRVVFNSSSPTSSGYTLNDFLAKGPVLQDELMSILMRFRTHKIVFTADIQKMYRQVLVKESDRKFQCILWRDVSSQLIRTFKLNTLTYGTKPASYLATKCLNKLANLSAAKYPESARIIESDFYMDDLLSGADNVEEAKLRIREIVEILASGCFPLRKFASNSGEVLVGLSSDQIVQSCHIEDSEAVSVLGVQWNSSEDQFVFVNNLPSWKNQTNITKRMFLAEIFRIFDPLGLLAPIVVKLKFLLQDVWRSGVNWDESIPNDIFDRFSTIRKNLERISSFAVPRFVGYSAESEVHIFCEASERGYGAAVYIRSMTEPGKFFLQLLCAKSRVAPVKTVSLPRLELFAALLGAKLYRKVRVGIRTQETNPVFAWSDSTIVLSWLISKDRRWATFVANRVSKVTAIIPPERWFHVRSEDNAADVISRGLESDFTLLRKFWQGPEFLCQSLEVNPFVDLNSEALAETRAKTKRLLLTTGGEDFLDRFSSYEKLVSFVAYYCRWKNLGKYDSVQLSLTEKGKAHEFLVKRSQANFSERIKGLDCFVDNGILRLRGRIGKSDLSYESKHPIILPKDRLLVLLVQFFHLRFFHAGKTFLRNFLRSAYHIMGDVNRVIRGVIYRCVTCRRFAANLNFNPPVGELPVYRVTSSQAFLEVGVDFAGPFLTRAVGPGRNKGKVIFKSYVSVFVCMASRAVHLEVVEDLSTKSFLDAFTRFISRRGLCQTVHSDHGTNFVGANRELRCAYNLLKGNSAKITEHCAKLGVSWNFIPERVPSFGGLWEAVVKSFKFHFKRVVGAQILSFAELTTLCCQIEAVLNARPLCTISDDSSTVITPAHLSIGRAITPLPPLTGAVMLGAVKVRFSMVQSIFRHFWSCWRQEYLIALRKGYFKKAGKRQAQVDDVVLVSDINTDPSEWPMGRIVKCFPGVDSVCRVVNVLINHKVFRRPVVKLIPLLPEKVETSCHKIPLAD